MKIQILLDFETSLTREQFDNFAQDIETLILNKKSLSSQLVKMQTQLVNNLILPNKGFRQ